MAIKGYVVRFLDGETACEVTPDSLTSAVRAVRELPAYDVSIFRVHDDGREERLPSYEEALQRSQDVASILTDGVPAIMRSSAPATREQIGAAACQMLKAIERALSVLRGSEAPLATLDIERRRLAAKGGA